jgi:hypothetical protein
VGVDSPFFANQALHFGSLTIRLVRRRRILPGVALEAGIVGDLIGRVVFELEKEVLAFIDFQSTIPTNARVVEELLAANPSRYLVTLRSRDESPSIEHKVSIFRCGVSGDRTTMTSTGTL